MAGYISRAVALPIGGRFSSSARKSPAQRDFFHLSAQTFTGLGLLGGIKEALFRPPSRLIQESWAVAVDAVTAGRLTPLSFLLRSTLRKHKVPVALEFDGDFVFGSDCAEPKATLPVIDSDR